MLEVTDCTLLLSRETGAPRRPLVILVSVRNQSNQSFTRCRLTLRLRTPRGFSAGELVLDGGVITPGEQVLSFDSSIPNQPIGTVECELAYMLGRWVTTVRGIAPHQRHAATAEPTPAPTAEDVPLEDVTMLPPVEGAEPSLGPDMDALDALGPDMDQAEADTGPDPDDPWSLLEAGELEAAKALFRASRLDSAGRDRVRAMLKSDAPEQIALGIQIGRWGSWAAPMVMRALLSHPAAQVRAAALTSLGLTAGPSLLGAVEPLVRDDDPGVREAATLAVARMRGLVPRVEDDDGA